MRTTIHDYPRSDNQRIEIEYPSEVDEHISMEQFANIVLDVSTLLIESGAHCERVTKNVQRIAHNTDFGLEMLISFTAVSVTISDHTKPCSTITLNKRVKHHGAHFGIITNTSLLTWEWFEDKISLPILKKRLSLLRATPKHSLWVVRLGIGIACGCLCLLAGGNWVDGLFAFFGSLIGLVIRQEMVKKDFNIMVSITSAAFFTTLISSLNILSNLGERPETSVATAVLYLIPGVPLINCIIDILQGYIPIGLSRGAYGGFILLSIAVGMYLCMNLVGIKNF